MPCKAASSPSPKKHNFLPFKDKLELIRNLKAPPYHTSRQAFKYTSASGGQHAHHSLTLFKTITASAAARLLSLNLPPKRPAMLPSITKKTRKSLTLEVKLDIIHRHERQEN
ncbi:hypothetical protein E2C01_015958 [Portunus trituberculatus]|uniref:Uncharacterized protein n=1 Tax=Portunus trituberculatus TaxID=210409 RepID=A0A5B7DPC6_PORTR|nr:hypothetical protein [Portunus trituberculatus]